MNDIQISPFLKWAGGKRWLVANHSEWFCYDAKRHLEPFLGGGAVYFHIRPKMATLTDVNDELISTYRAIRDDPITIERHLRRHQTLHCDSYYYEIRRSKPRTPATLAARFIYLNRTCFNGLYRVNLQGKFNVPKGTKSTIILHDDNFSVMSGLLRSATLETRDFVETVRAAGDGDFLYVDPPYTVKHNQNNFIKYNERIFSWADQVRLSKCVLEAARRGAKILISNADHPSIHELYDAKLWTQIKVERFSRLAASSKFRKGTTELIVSNYLSPDGRKENIRT